MLRALYTQLLRAHPAGFRDRFCDEMLEAFDYARDARERRQLVADCAVSLARQWVLRADFHDAWQPASAGPVYDELSFRQIEPYQPRAGALANGAVLSVLIMIGIGAAVQHPSIVNFSVGMHRPAFGLIQVARAEGAEPNTLVQADVPTGDPLLPFARSYFHLMPVLAALDADGDHMLSADEIATAPAALLMLDRNHDGRLSAEECGFRPAGDLSLGARPTRQDKIDFMAANPVLAALDANGDGVISGEEIKNSAAALFSLDLDHDGKLSGYEILPHHAVSSAAAMMNRFDTNDVGVISLQGLPKDDPDLEKVRRFLSAADRNRDGLVTRGELLLEFSLRGNPSEPSEGH